MGRWTVVAVESGSPVCIPFSPLRPQLPACLPPHLGCTFPGDEVPSIDHDQPGSKPAGKLRRMLGHCNEVVHAVHQLDRVAP